MPTDAPASDIEIAHAAEMDLIADVAARLGIPVSAVEPYGRYKAKIDLDYLAALPVNPDARLVLVTAISPTPPGEGKTTTSVGLPTVSRRSGNGPSCACANPPSDQSSA